MGNKSLFIALIALVVVLAGAYGFMQYQESRNVSVSLNNSQAANGGLEYTNADYGFKLKLNSAWDGYRVFKLGNDNVSSYDFCVKTTDTTYSPLNPDQAGYACPMSVFAISESAWNQMADLERLSFGEPVSAKDNVRFFVSEWMSAPSDLANIDFGTDSVRSSFRF